MQSFDTPILLLTYKRLDTTEKVLKKIAEIQPINLYVASNAPNPAKANDEEKVAAVRSMIENRIDWPCNLRKLYRTDHLGAGVSISSAITWFFEHVEEGIILEDDIVPSNSFFEFAKELLHLYRDDSAVWHIGGNSYNPYEMKPDYYFSAYPHIWGWATWRRAWNNYRFELDDIETGRLFANIRKLFLTDSESKYWIDFFNEYSNMEIKNTWDYQWTYRMWYNNGLAILPKRNLITNIGFDETATHTIDKTSWLANLETYEIDIPKLKEPIKQNKKADLFTSRKVFYIRSAGRKILSEIKRVLISSLKQKTN